MLTRTARRLDEVRFAAWRRYVETRLGRLGVEVGWEIEATPRWWTLPHVEPVVGRPGPGQLTVRLGREVKLGRELILEVWTGCDSRFELGDRTTFEAYCRVQLQGGTVRLSHDVHVRDLVLLKSKATLEVGEWTVLSRGVHVHATAGVTIGAHGAIGERTSFIDSDHEVGGEVPVLRRPVRTEPIVLGRNVAVSANCVLLRGTRIGDGAVVAAGAVVNGGEHPGGWLLAGLPARPLRALAEPDGA